MGPQSLDVIDLVYLPRPDDARASAVCAAVGRPPARVWPLLFISESAARTPALGIPVQVADGQDDDEVFGFGREEHCVGKASQKRAAVRATTAGNISGDSRMRRRVVSTSVRNSAPRLNHLPRATFVLQFDERFIPRLRVVRVRPMLGETLFQ